MLTAWSTSHCWQRCLGRIVRDIFTLSINQALHSQTRELVDGGSSPARLRRSRGGR